MLKYERPANTSEEAKQKRATYAQKFYDQFMNPTPQPEPTPEPTPKPSVKKIVKAKVKVNLRTGNSISTQKIGVLAKGQAPGPCGAGARRFKARSADRGRIGSPCRSA